MDHYSPIADSGEGQDLGLGDGEIMLTSKATMFFRINRYENDCVPIADSSLPDGWRYGEGSGTADRADGHPWSRGPSQGLPSGVRPFRSFLTEIETQLVPN
jgi:hypothetical protein